MPRTEAEIVAAQQARTQQQAGGQSDLLLPELRLPDPPAKIINIDPAGWAQWKRETAANIREWTKNAIFNLRGG